MTDPHELLELLSKDADPRKAKSLRVIHEVCEEQRRRGSFDFSVATIGRLSSEKKGPAAGAIRNTTGEAYRALVKSHLDAAGGKKPKGKPHKADENPFEGITDPVLRARIGILLAENESLKGQLHATRNLANTKSIVDLKNRVDEPAEFTTPPCKNNLTQQEWLSLEHARDRTSLLALNFVIDANGRVKTSCGTTIFKPGFLSALDKIVTNVDNTRK